MPFTFAHPAIVLPLTFLPRSWFSATGLIAGSLAPDFEYFLRMKVKSQYSHTLSGVFWFDLPLGLALAFLFHHVARNRLFDNLPFSLKARLSTFTHFNWNNHFKTQWFTVVLSILMGAGSHLLWDNFTHHQGYFVQVLPFLIYQVEIWSWQIPLFKILQHASSLIGGIIILIVLFKLPKTNPLNNSANPKYWITLTAITVLIVAVRFSGGLPFKFYGHFIVTVIAAFLLALVLTPALLRLNGNR